jgi:deoxyadenosine/deoxycytidine kinase
MGKVILVAGNSGVGKTTLTAELCHRASFATGLEQHTERPFQALMAGNLNRFALANQVDYLLLRTEQERAIRHQPLTGLIDGGLDLDFFGFTRLFRSKGYLTEAEYALCERLYLSLRDLLGPPDLILYLTAPLAMIERRYARRGRALEIARREDLASMDSLIAEWIDSITDLPVITIDATIADFGAPAFIAPLLDRIRSALNLPA